jgi:hypothetical protein
MDDPNGSKLTFQGTAYLSDQHLVVEASMMVQPVVRFVNVTLVTSIAETVEATLDVTGDVTTPASPTAERI